MVGRGARRLVQHRGNTGFGIDDDIKINKLIYRVLIFLEEER